MRIRTKTEKAARTRKRNANPLLAAKKQAERPQPAKPDWETLRPLILAKSDGCYLCGRPLTLETMTTDHMVIRNMGQPKNDDFSNLMPCCFTCNWQKGSRRLNEVGCVCGQKHVVYGLPCFKCGKRKRNYENSGVRTERTGRFTI